MEYGCKSFSSTALLQRASEKSDSPRYNMVTRPYVNCVRLPILGTSFASTQINTLNAILLPFHYCICVC